MIEVTLKYVQFGLQEPDDFQLLYQRSMLPDQQEGIPRIFTQCAQNQSVQLNEPPKIAAQTMWSIGHGIVLLTLHRDVSEEDHRLMVEAAYRGLQKIVREE